MSKNKDIHTFYNMLMEKYKFYQDAITPFMQLRTKNEEEIKQIYQNLKTTFLDSNIYSPVNVYNLINNIFPYNNRYLTSYWSIFKMIYEDYHIKPDSYFEPVLKYFFYKENNLNIRAYDKKLFQKYENENYSLEVHEENTIYWAIMKDDLQLFISYALDSNFDKNQTLRSGLYPLINGFEQYSLLEICCYHGAVKGWALIGS
ncbi:hypothetical protein TVAG_286710 [Trichomonas vaginalis G3]|uniref:DUF3447 domain-containing protein n=1 Tax=Trichomonas vaginalis (strain ATCC PRA-98 / G3) TaxID=412133 RepID=A2F3F4_TRIV3|nr:spectrin binding [Trichomonas vaginalis G3]EAY00534.1 hypothetical protein TVAG_286710 [Trichomonas vaginalis G3]KAI5553606.1 spectrin binding [Trichomonas vaginalis G3]|eukprot:XP_001313463.1 hypothetical protein [Trichomonas vaginalis G3]